MALDVSLFLATKAAPVKETTYVVSDRFVDQDGKPVAWVLKPVRSAKEREIKKNCIKGNKFDEISYIEQITAETVVDPNPACLILRKLTWFRVTLFSLRLYNYPAG